MVGRRYLLAIVMLLLASPTLSAQPSIVNIQLRTAETDAPRTIEVTPNATGVCRNTPGCPTELEFRWVGAAGDETERIWIEYQPGLFWNEDGKPAVVYPAECFSFPDGENPFALQNGPSNGRSLVFRQDSESCPDKAAFFYAISCKNESGEERAETAGDCGGIEALDPATMVDNGRR
jgi:hypothetical protein